MSFTNFLRQTKWIEKKLFVEAFFVQLYVKCLLLFLPFNSCVKRFKKIDSTTTKIDPELARLIKNSLIRCAKVVQWKNHCLVHSITARYMLNRRKLNSKLYLGLQLNEHQVLKAHAWIESAGLDLVERNGEYVEIYDF